MIQVHALEKRFGRVEAVRNVSFRARDGSITGLLGSNGAGKSTTLRMIAGILQPQRGTIHIQGSCGALLDHTGIYARLTARENLLYFGRLRGLPPPLLAGRVDEVLALLDLQAIADRRTAGFSQGERMKTALARALIHSPQNLLLDEPASGLDVPAQRALRALLQHMRADGKCILFSSHVLAEVQMVCDEIVIISHGSVVAQGTPEALCRQAHCDSLEDAFVALSGGSEESCAAY